MAADKFDNGTHAFLVTDVAIACHTAAHDEVVSLAWTAIGIYPLGLLGLNTALLFGARTAIRTGKPTTLGESTRFLYREYKLAFFW